MHIQNSSSTTQNQTIKNKTAVQHHRNRPKKTAVQPNCSSTTQNHPIKNNHETKSTAFLHNPDFNQ